MALRTLSAKNAAALDEELMGPGAFSLDQLMELAGFAVSSAVHILEPPTKGKKILMACGPGNNGGDGLVAARHLCHFGYEPSIFYPKPGKNELYQRLTTQLKDLDIPFVDDFDAALKETDFVVDAIFVPLQTILTANRLGFSFTGEVRDPFRATISSLTTTQKRVLAVDAPSSWNIESGPPSSGPGSDYMPEALISLTAPKPLVKRFTGRHFVGGRFLSQKVASKYDINVPDYRGEAQIAEVPVGDGDGKL